LSTNSIFGAIVDCGYWGNTKPPTKYPSSGNGSGESGSDFAAIAYSGDIADLKQEREDIIIFTGGTAPRGEI
jgi:hypothetical protein